MRFFVASVLLFCILQPLQSAEINNSASVSVCMLPSGSLEVTWAAVAQVVGDDVESVQSLAITGE